MGLIISLLQTLKFYRLPFFPIQLPKKISLHRKTQNKHYQNNNYTQELTPPAKQYLKFVESIHPTV